MDLDNTFETTYFLVFWERGQNCYDYTIIEAYKFESTYHNSLLLNPLISQSLSFREYINSPLTTEKGRIVASSSKFYNLHHFFVFCMLYCFSYVSLCSFVVFLKLTDGFYGILVLLSSNA